ncbi:hypothetical protein ACIBQ1_37590 [Nonomuraea sp. NPDC050153]|uniref:hypothetical protein n=1 Tax=Nonomuraea sp. NPDC050153 TaxID=3364359 RepID=UPI0037AABBBC
MANRRDLKVVIGTRYPAARIGAGELIIDLGTAPYLDPQALGHHVKDLFIASREPEAATPYRRERSKRSRL